MSVQTASRRLTLELERNQREQQCGAAEADTDLNNASRAVIQAVCDEHGSAWLVKLNPGTITAVTSANDVRNFDADIALPQEPSAEFKAALDARLAHHTTYSVKQDIQDVKRIFELCDQVGGQVLVWS